jgi:hypothetical protein
MNDNQNEKELEFDRSSCIKMFMRRGASLPAAEAATARACVVS